LELRIFRKRKTFISRVVETLRIQPIVREEIPEEPKKNITGQKKKKLLLINLLKPPCKRKQHQPILTSIKMIIINDRNTC
jgi:hypothetical protein